MTPDLAEKWIAYHSTNDEALFWAFEELCSLCEGNPEQAWQVVQQISNLSTDPKILGNLVAGPLEDILHYHGLDFIERFEIYTRQHPEFVTVAKGVWVKEAAKEVRDRVRVLQEQYS
jgi:hypothetical protein